VPATVEDAGVVDKAKAAVKEYFTTGEGAKIKAKL
jgi:propionyl-CoA synthetase